MFLSANGFQRARLVAVPVIVLLVVLAANRGGEAPLARSTVLRATPDASPVHHLDPIQTAETGTPAAHQHDSHAIGNAATPTAAEQAAADRFVSEVMAGSGRFTDIEVARAEGYVQMMPYAFDEIGAAHFINTAFARDDGVLDPRRPEGLIYLKTADDRLVLLGIMFVAAPNAGPTIGGPLMDWHMHPELCIGRSAILPKLADGTCLRATVPIDFEMTHVWTVPNRLGPFAHVLPAADTAAATGQSVDQVRHQPLVDDAELQAVVARVLRLDPDEIARRFEGGESLAEMAAAQQIPRRRIVGAIDRAAAASLAEAVAAGDLPPEGRRMIERFISAQIAALLDLHASDIDPSPATTEFGYPCTHLTCLIRLPTGDATPE